MPINQQTKIMEENFRKRVREIVEQSYCTRNIILVGAAKMNQTLYHIAKNLDTQVQV